MWKLNFYKIQRFNPFFYIYKTIYGEGWPSPFHREGFDHTSKNNSSTNSTKSSINKNTSNKPKKCHELHPFKNKKHKDYTWLHLSISIQTEVLTFNKFWTSKMTTQHDPPPTSRDESVTIAVEDLEGLNQLLLGVLKQPPASQNHAKMIKTMSNIFKTKKKKSV